MQFHIYLFFWLYVCPSSDISLQEHNQIVHTYLET